MPDINGAIQNATIDTAMGAAVGESAGDIATDIVLDELIDALVEEYAKASIEMQGKCDNYFSKYAKEDAEKRSQLDAKKISKEEYQAWQKSKILGGKQWTDMRDTLAQDLTHCNEIAADIINDRKCDVYALNRNYGTYEIEQGVGACTSYTLYDHDTVERLISQNPELLPKTKIDIPKDLRWNKQQLTSAVTQGILQGESIPGIARRMAAVTDMDKNSAIRNARTATTGAENAGRVESYKRAEKMGIKVTQIWISTLDGRTRTSHRHMMGEKRALGKAFSNKCRFPGDPQGPGWEVYNCRCALIAEPDGSGYDLEKTIDKNLSKKGMTFDEWVNQQPLPRHYGESKQHYLERYAKHKKQLSFGEWLGEQAAPDSAIQSVWGNKKMSQMYNEIKAQSVTDANKFYKELGKLGKPSEVWEKYLTGQLDAEDMKNFEDILKKYLPKQNIDTGAGAINNVAKLVGGKNDPEITDNIRDYFLPQKTKEKLDWIENIDTYDDFEKYLKKKGIDLDVGIDKLKNEMKFDTMPPAVKTQCQKIATALEAYEDEFGPGCLSKLKKIYLYDDDLDAKASYFFNQLGEHDPLAGEIHFRDWNASGHDIFHELAHAFQDSHAIKGKEDALLYSKRMVKEAKMPADWQAYTGAISDEAMDAERFAEAFGNAFTRNSPTRQEFVYRVAGIENKTINVPKVKDKTGDNITISKEAQDSLDKLKLKAGNPMDKDAADSYKVNPLYDKADKATTKNCQTSAFAYECRRQGYDVVALPKYGLDIDDPELKEILQLQNTLGKNARLGWINKETGAPATVVIEHSNPMMVMSNPEMIDELENAIGKSGERYIMGVRWKGTTSCHAINIDRTPDGKLRIIDNQRGPLEKNTWVGIEVEDYLDNVQRIKHVTRVDDCVPNAEYFNKIVVDAKKVKADLPSNVSAFKDYSKVSKQAKDAGEKTSTYYVKWKAGLIDNKDLDDLLTHGAAPKIDLDTYKANLLKDPKLENMLDDIAIEAAKDNQLFTNDYLMAYLKGEKQNDYLDNMLKKNLPSPDPTLTKADDIAKHNDDILKYYKDKSLYDADVPMEVAGISVNKYFKAGLNSASDYWNKYKLGEIKDAEIDKILGIKSVSTSTPVSASVSAKADFIKKWENTSFKNLPDDAYAKVMFGGSNKGIPASEYWEKYLAGEIKNSKLDEILSLPDSIQNVEFIHPATGEVLNKFDELEKIKNMPVTNLDDMAQTLVKDYYDLKLDDAKQILKDLGLNIPEKTTETIVSALEIAKEELKSGLDTGSWSAIYFKVAGIDSDLAHELKDIASKIKVDKGFEKNYDVLEAYFDGTLKSTELDDIFAKIYKDKIPTVPATPIAPVKSTATTAASTTAVDIDAVKDKKVTAIYNEIKADLGTSEANAFYNKTLKQIGAKNNLSQGEVWKKYLGGELDADDIKKIDDHLIKKYSKTVEPPKPTFDKSAFDNKKMSQVYNDIKATDTATANKFYNDLKKMGKPSEVWDEYLKGTLPQDKMDIIEAHLKKKYTAAPPAQGAKTGAAAMDAEAQKKLDEAKKKLDEATQELETIKKELPENKTYSGIWKEDVTLDDYELKKSTIAAKNVYYLDEIDKLKNDPSYNSFWDDEKKKSVIEKYEQYLNDLEEFEIKGQEYLAKKTEVDKKIKSAEKKVADAKKNVSDLTPVGEAYTPQRKDAAKWFTSKSYKDGDKYYSALPATKTAHKSATSAEHSAYVEYTSASGGFNRPLAGFKAPQYSGGSGWDEKYYKGVGNVPLDNENKGKDIKNLTTFVEKSKMEDDIWVQTAQNYATLEGKNGFLGVPYGSLSGMTDSQLQQFVGVENQLGQFISASINRGGGSYTPGNMRINIYCPKGSEALYVLSDGTFGKAEHEIILQRGGTYKVSKIYWGTDAEHGGKKLIVDLELRLEKGYNKYEK